MVAGEITYPFGLVPRLTVPVTTGSETPVSVLMYLNTPRSEAFTLSMRLEPGVN